MKHYYTHMKGLFDVTNRIDYILLCSAFRTFIRFYRELFDSCKLLFQGIRRYTKTKYGQYRNLAKQNNVYKANDLGKSIKEK